MDKASKNLFRLWKISFLLMLTLFLIGGYFSYRYHVNQKVSQQIQSTIIQEQSVLIEAMRKNKQQPFLAHVLKRVRTELNDAQQDTLSNDLISNISALSTTFEPYLSLEGDSLSYEIYSPERGQLLLTLSTLPIDSLSFHRVKLRTSFAHARLQKAVLRKKDLQDVQLNSANLSNADLRGANLSDAKLKGGNLWNVNLQKANLENADLRETNLSWADLKETNLSAAQMNKSNLSLAKLNKSNLKNANLRGATLHGTLFIESNLDSVNMATAKLMRASFNNSIMTNVVLRYTDLTQTNFSGADLRRADLRFAALSATNLSNTKLDSAIVDASDWLEYLTEWEVIGTKQVRANYQVVVDTLTSLFHLRKIEE